MVNTNLQDNHNNQIFKYKHEINQFQEENLYL